MIWLSNNIMDNNVDNFPPLPWHERREDTPRVDLSAPSVLGKLSSYAFQGNSFLKGNFLLVGKKQVTLALAGSMMKALKRMRKVSAS